MSAFEIYIGKIRDILKYNFGGNENLPAVERMVSDEKVKALYVKGYHPKRAVEIILYEDQKPEDLFIAPSGRNDMAMDEQKMKLSMAAIVDMATEELTDLELAILNNVAQLGMDPHDRAFDYEEVKSLFTEKDGTRMHEETKAALAAVVNRRLVASRKDE